MRLIGKLTDHRQAERFVAYLVTQGIQSHIEPENEEYEIWIKDEDLMQNAVSALESFRDSPDAPEYVDAPNKARAIQNEMIRKRKRIAKNVVNVSERMKTGNQSLTILLMVFAGLISLLTNFGHPSRMDRVAFRSMSFVSEFRGDFPDVPDKDDVSWRLNSVLSGEVWRLVTPIFLHFDVFHLVFNMYWLFLLGRQIENRYGTFWFAMLVISAAVVSNFAQCVVPESVGGSAPYLRGQYFITPMGGMSGVNYALFGFMWMRIIYEPNCGLQLSQLTIFFLLGWLIFCMTPLAIQEFEINVANWAHAIGMLVGVIAGYWPTVVPPRRSSA